MTVKYLLFPVSVFISSAVIPELPTPALIKLSLKRWEGELSIIKNPAKKAGFQ